MDDLSFVIVGHVDHGKSTLIGRLLYDTNSLPIDKVEELKAACKALGRELEFSFITDHLQEEREQNVTIDTSQIKFKTETRNYTIIDAPGHKEFLKNMITGASQAEAAVLIVDASEGVREQTKRHASIVQLLGLRQVMVVVNKMDLVGFSQKKFDQVKAELAAFLSGLGVEPLLVIPIVAKDGDNIVRLSDKMSWYTGPTLLAGLAEFSGRVDAVGKPLRYSVQDVYKVGDKRILVGRVESGLLQVGQDIVFLPSNKHAQVKSIEVFGKSDKVRAEAGESIGITLSEALFIERGEIACAGRLPHVTQMISATVFWLSPQQLEKDRLLLKVSTQEVFCRVEHVKLIDSSSGAIGEEDTRVLHAAELGRMVLALEKPIVVENFSDIEELGRFVLERDGEVSAGGIVVSKGDV